MSLLVWIDMKNHCRWLNFKNLKITNNWRPLFRLGFLNFYIFCCSRWNYYQRNSMLRTYQTNYRLFSLSFGWRERFTSICHTELQSFIRGHTRSVFLGPELCKVTLCLRTNSFPVFQSPRLIARPCTYRLDSSRYISVENNRNKYKEIDFVMERVIILIKLIYCL